jgi:hypothetical protein
MIRVVLIVLVAAGFIVTGDIPTLVTGCQCGFLAIQNRAMGILNSEKVKILPGGKDKQNKDHLKFGSCTPGTSVGIPDRDKFPTDATRSVNLKELVAGSRLVLWLVKKNGVQTTQLDVLNPLTGEVLLTHADAPARPPKRGRMNTSTLREGNEVSLQYKQRSQFDAGFSEQSESLGAILAIEKPRLNQESSNIKH